MIKCSIQENQILDIYLHGSRVYGTFNKKSDYDYIVVVKDYPEPKSLTEQVDNNSFAIVKQSSWERVAKHNDPVFMECIFSPKEYKIKETYIPNFEFDYEKIRRNFSQKASNSWVKCKKKLTVEKDYSPYIGKKSMWHSLRLLMYGIQLCKYGKIIDYKEANKYYKDIVVDSPNNWEYLKNKYQPIYNKLKSEFKESYKIR